MKKKSILWTMAAALTLTGCTQDEIIGGGQYADSNAITFGTYVGRGAQTRATEVTQQTLERDGFGVNAWYTKDANFADADATKKEAFMTDTRVTYNADKGAWTYSPLKYWPNMLEHKVSFFAYGPYSVTSQLNDDKTAIEFTVENDVQNQVDLIYNTNYEDAIDQEKPSVEDKVEFQFDHALSRIAFSVEAAVDVVKEDKDNSLNIDANTVINVKRVALVGTDAEDGQYIYVDDATDADSDGNLDGPFYTGGTLTLLKPVADADGNITPWSAQTGGQSFLLDAEDFYRTVTDATSGEVVQLHKFNRKQRLTDDDAYLMIIPQDLTTTASEGFKIYIEYDVITEGEDGDGSTITNHIVSAEPMSVNFEQGKAYNFNLVLGMTSVKFGAEVTEWVTDENLENEEEEWLPENKCEGNEENEGNEDNEEPSTYNLIAATYLTHNGTQILIEDANDLGEARDFINAGYQYKLGEEAIVYRVEYLDQATFTTREGDIVEGEGGEETDDDLTIEGDDPVVMPDGGEGESEAEPTDFPYFYAAPYLQTNDITLSGEWTPIGIYGMPFNGTYTVAEKESGEYYVISGLTISTGYSYTNESYESSTTTTYGGLFYGLGSDATVSNIRMTNVNISNVDYAAAIAASGSGFTISNCIVGTESDNSTINGTNAAGIHAGSDGSSATVENCINHATVTGEHVAGISCGYATVKSCKNYGTIGDKSTSNAGGISSYATSIIDCQNHGDITANYQVAGIVYSINGGEIKGSYNTGTVSSTANKAGEIVAVIDNSPTSATATITGCYSTQSNCPLIGSVELSSFYESFANATVEVNLTSCYSVNNKIIGQTYTDESATYDARKLTLTCQACYYSGDEAFSEEISVAEGVTKVDGTDVTWTAAAGAMNEALTDTEWTYTDNGSNPPTFGTASAE